jgi:hypothetical protein
MSNERQRPRCRPTVRGTCGGSGKRRFRDHAEAVAALHCAQNSRQWAARDGMITRRREIRSYRCPMCNGWHLTSQPPRADGDAPLGMPDAHEAPPCSPAGMSDLGDP